MIAVGGCGGGGDGIGVATAVVRLLHFAATKLCASDNSTLQAERLGPP